MSTARFGLTAALAATAIALVACGDEESTDVSSDAPETTEEVIVQAADGDFNPNQIYKDVSPGVVTVVSVFGDAGEASILGGGGAGQGSGFVISDDGEIVTNAHVVTQGGSGNGGGRPQKADSVFVEFADRNRVPAEVVGFDSDADVALIKIDPDGLDLKPVAVSERDEFAVGEPVAAIGSPFGRQQSLSIGIVSAIDRSIPGLTQFTIDNAIQTDASINPGNSGGPLIDGEGEVIGINQQIETESGTNSGVGFAIPANAIRFSLEQLREDGSVDYAYLGVSTQGVWPQLNDELDLGADRGALIASVVPGGPADDAGLEGGDDRRFFQGQRIDTGGDMIVAVDGTRLEHESDLAELVSRRRPGETVTLEILRDGESQEIEVELEERPERVAPN